MADVQMVDGAICRELQEALEHLYDPGALQRSSLVQGLRLGQAADASAALRRALVGAIEALKPSADVPPQSKAWRIYHILIQRYVEQFAQQQVADALALSTRQLRRQEHEAVMILAEYLSRRYQVDRRAWDSAVKLRNPARPERATGASSREQELAWLKKTLPSEPVDLVRVITGVLDTIRPLAARLCVTLDGELPGALPYAVARAAPLRQSLLNLLELALQMAAHGRVHVAAHAEGQSVVAAITTLPGPSADGTLAQNTEAVQIARELLDLSGGELATLRDAGRPGAWVCEVKFPVSARIPVLIIEDNADTLQLIGRFLANTVYEPVAVKKPAQALEAAREALPRAILLDVMLPGIDGWELLGRLREHPETHDIPIIICTILPTEQLALTLGAAAFLRKPISRQQLLAELDRQVIPQPAALPAPTESS